MTAQDLTKLAQHIMGNAYLPEDGKAASPEQLAALASAYALIAIAQQLAHINDSLDSVIGEVQDRPVLRTFSTNSRYE